MLITGVDYSIIKPILETLQYYPRGVVMDVLDRIREQVEGNPVVLYMKGTPQFPMCGFSSRAAEALKACGVPFAYVNVLGDQEIFENLPRYADWPTFPQLYIEGDLVGGCDITLELFENGELQKMAQAAVEKSEQANPE